MIRNLVTIIVPIFNTEAFLEQCLYSLINQSYKSLEIICINDGSNDGSYEILKRFSVIDQRINIINKDNEGVSASRNIALAQAKGEFIMFVDADDWLEPNTVELAIHKMIECSSDVVIWSYCSERSNKSVTKHIFDKEYVFSDIDIRNRIHRRFIGLINEEISNPELADSLCPVWGKLYRSTLIKDIHFVDLKIIGTYEDGLFNLNVFGRVKKAVYMDLPLYHYRRYNDSSQTNNYRERLFEQWNELFKLMHDYIISNGLTDDYLLALQNRRALSVLGLGLNILSSDKSSRDKMNLLKSIVSNNSIHTALGALDTRFMKIHWRLFYICARNRNIIFLFLLLKVINSIIRR